MNCERGTFCEPSGNPLQEQAISRSYRMGQSRDVYISNY